MEILDEYQDGSNNVVNNLTSINAHNHHHHHHHHPAHHRHNSESPMSHQDEDLSDPDRQDEESGEELPQQPLQAAARTSSEITPTSTPLAHLNNLMNSTQPHILAKIKLENDIELLNNKSGLEALQAAMSSGTFNLPFKENLSAFLSPSQPTTQHSVSSLLNQSSSNNNNNSSINNNSGNARVSSAGSYSSESSQGSGRHGIDNSNRDSVGPTANYSGSQNIGGQQQSSWSFEEQFKQVRQLYELTDEPMRKEFLDDLFSFMQQKGTPINRLPIMAKSVLDLYELYNLVINRGGLVEVINKKLWQEIIKGLHLPSSITSAAFTLRTQYMKYLYPYECATKNLSTPEELRSAIEGNRREGRRNNYAAYGTPAPPATSVQQQSSVVGDSSLLMPSTNADSRGVNSIAHSQISPISLVTAIQQAAAATGNSHQLTQNYINGNIAHSPINSQLRNPQHQPTIGSANPIGEFELRMAEYVKQLQREMSRRSVESTSVSGLVAATQAAQVAQVAQAVQAAQAAAQHAASTGSPPSRSPTHDATLFEMSRLNLWNSFYNNNMHNSMNYPHLSPNRSMHSPMQQLASPEPQKEALDLGLRSSSSSGSNPGQISPASHSSMPMKRELENDTSPQSKRICTDEDVERSHDKQANLTLVNSGPTKDGKMVISMEINGVKYSGVLYASTTNNNENITSEVSTINPETTVSETAAPNASTAKSEEANKTASRTDC